MVSQNVTGLQWLASEAWSGAVVLQEPHLMPYLRGTLGIAIRRGEIPGLRDFLLQIRPDQISNITGYNMVRVQSYDIVQIFREETLIIMVKRIFCYVSGSTVLGILIPV